MAINLKQISVSDSDNIKLDKTNYNFDQLVANGGGPQGNVGPKGETGPQGVTGATGEKGNQGYQGTQGPQGSNDTASWRRIQGSGANLTTDTILPIHNNTMLYPPVVSVGFLETDPEYNTAQPFDGANSPYQWIINRKNHFKSNLRLTNAGISNYFDFIMNYDSVTLQNNLTIESKNGVSSTITWYAQNHIFKSNVTGATLLNISDSSITYNTDTIFNRPVTINRNLIIGNSSAGANKIAVAADDTGKVTFKTALEIGGIVPVGTIISILPSIFTDSAKFINSQIYNAANSPEKDLPIPIKVGGGIGDYTGWYLCNGKTWTNGTTNYVLPDLNSFSYSIADNTTSTSSTSQGVASITNSEIALIGGADASLTATTSSPGIYSISGTVQTTSVLLNANGSGTSLTIKKLPQIIYLGVADLYWKDGGVLPQAINTYTFDDLNNTATGCVTTTKTDTRAEGAVSPAITFTQTITAPSSYYFQTIPTAASFTEVNSGYTVTNVVSGGGTYPTSIIVTVSVSTQGINGTQRSITYNTTSNIATIPAYTITYKFIDENTNNGVPTVQITNTGVQGSNTIPLGNVLISAASLSPGMHWTSVPSLTIPSGSGLSATPSLYVTDTTDKTIIVNMSVTSQPADGAFTNNIVEIKYNSLAHKAYDTISLSLVRANSPSYVSITVPPVTNSITNWHYQNGWTGDVVINANTGYTYSSPNDVNMYSNETYQPGDTYSNGTEWASFVYTINSRGWTPSTTVGKSITMNITIKGNATAGSTYYYGISGNPVLTSIFTFVSHVGDPVTSGSGPIISAGANGGSYSYTGTNIVDMNGTTNQYVHLLLDGSLPSGITGGTRSGSLNITAEPGYGGSVTVIPTGTPTPFTISGEIINASPTASVGSFLLTPGRYRISMIVAVSNTSTSQYGQSSTAIAYLYRSTNNTNPWTLIGTW